MNATNPIDDVECRRCHQPTAIWDIGLCWPCLHAESNERLQARVMDGSVEENIFQLLLFVQTLKTAAVTTESRRQFDEHIKKIQSL